MNRIPYTAVRSAGSLLFVSGQSGAVDGQLVPGGVQPEFRQAFTNVAAMLRDHGGSMSEVVKATVFLRDMADWASMNEVYLELFKDPLPARTVVGVSGLPRHARVLLEVVVAKGGDAQ